MANSYKNNGNNLVLVLTQYIQYIDSISPSTIFAISELPGRVYLLTNLIISFCFLTKSPCPRIISLNFEKGEIIIKTNINYGNLCSYNKKLDRALVFENEKIPYLINKKGEIISNLSEKIADLNASENMYFKFINGIGELVVVKKSWDGEEEKFDYQYYLIDINGNIIKKMLKGTSDLIMDCNYGNR